MRKSFTIHDLPKDERPRERMLKSGAHNLTDKELLVTLLGRGIGGESVMVTAQRLWGRFRNIKRIADASIEELAQVRGIGPAKATQIKAAFELGRRLSGNHKPPEPFIKWAGGKSQLLDNTRHFSHRNTINISNHLSAVEQFFSTLNQIKLSFPI